MQLLEKYGIAYDLNPHGRKLSEAEISELLGKDNYSGLLAGTETISRQVLEKAASLKIVSRIGVGLDNIDLKAAQELDIKVMNTPLCLTDSVAELTTGMILAALRKITLMNNHLHNRQWKKESGLLLRGKTLGIVGFGNIGKRVAELANCLKARVLFSDIKDIPATAAEQVSFDKILSDCDIITFHLSSKEKIIAKNEISRMKNGVILINTSRGTVIDEESLHEGLLSGKVAFAALDVYDKEPYSGKLAELENIILTPHIGSYAKEARIEMETEAVNNLLRGLRLSK